MKRILIFSGTTEGRRITEFLDGRNVKVYVSAATEYGKECTGEHENAEVFFGRMDQKQMTEMIKEKQIDLVIDATHPFAQLVTGEIRRACEISGVQYLRCLREKMEAVPDEADRVIWAQSVEDAVEYIQSLRSIKSAALRESSLRSRRLWSRLRLALKESISLQCRDHFQRR